jgi:Trk K+ transport system NAD-binding subunit
LKVDTAARVVASVDDMMNTNIAFTVREISQTVPIVANADLDDSVDILQLAGSDNQFNEYDEKYGQGKIYQTPVLILGGGRVGRAAADALTARNIDYRIIEKKQNLIEDERYIYGSAADINTLMKAGIKKTPSIIITTHDDPTNIYLTIYCRRLSPDVQIISRANIERNISKLHTAGADLVLSYASMAASTILNLLMPGELLMLAEGLNVFRVVVPPVYIGNSLAESQIRSQTGCNVIAICDPETMCFNPEPSYCFKESDELILIGSEEAESRFFKMNSEMRKIKAS